MIGSISKTEEKTVYGKNLEVKTFDLLSPASRPLTDLGVARAYLSSRNNEYLLIRGNNEPLHYDVVFVLAGELTLETDTGEFALIPGDMLHIPSNLPRRIEMTKGKCYKELIFSFTDDQTIDLFRTREVIIRQANQLSQLIGTVENYFNERNRQDTLSSRALQAYVELIAVLLFREVGADMNIDPRWDNSFSGLREKILTNPEKDWSVEEMAHNIAVSPSYLYHLTRTLFGKTPIAFLAEIRMKEAQSLLTATDYTLETISTLVGYTSAYAFSNAFKRHTGIRPGAFRKTNMPGKPRES